MSALPAWLWSIDATRLLWANPVGEAIFAAPVSTALRASRFGARGPAAVQVARLAATLRADGETRLAQLSGLGAGVGGILSCACSCITLSDHTPAVLVAATERAGADWPLVERVRRLIARCSEPVAAFSSGGMLIHASPSAQPRLGGATTLIGLGVEPTAAAARQCGRATTTSSAGPLTIERVEVEAATILVGIFTAPPQAEPSQVAELVGSARDLALTRAPAAEPLRTERPAAAEPPAAEPPAATRPAPLRFVWQMDTEQRFTIDSEEFLALAGARTAAVIGQPWPHVAAALGLDPQGEIALALKSQDTWSGLSVAWPAQEGCQPLLIELSGLPVLDRERVFRGYRGFGICRKVARPAAGRTGRSAVPAAAELAAEVPDAMNIKNVVPLRPTGQPAAPILSALERSAFHELTRKLQERLQAAESFTSESSSSSPSAAQAPLPPAQHAASARQQRQPAGDPDSTLRAAQAEILRLNQILETTRLQAERAAAAKSDFLARISHEIRSPLNAIIGFSEIMAQEKFGPLGNERYRQYLGDIQTSGVHLLSLINDLIDLSRHEAGKLELDFAHVALGPMIQQCVAILQPQANRERIIVRTSLSPKLPLVIADARALRQIVLNLISHSSGLAGPGGQVIVSTALSEAGEVVLRMRDNGIGMSEQEIALALQPFRRAAATVRPAPGTGFGLPLAKVLAEANRASLTIGSAADAGTLIELLFPAERTLPETRQ